LATEWINFGKAYRLESCPGSGKRETANTAKKI
jgi:hypothetical protein